MPRLLALAAAAVAALAGSERAGAATFREACERALAPGEGAVVALDPRSGEVLALGHPEDGVARAFPPGSLFKVVAALAAQRAAPELLDAAARCPGRGLVAGRWLGCWLPGGHRAGVRLDAALAHSCNFFFYRLGERLGAAALAAAARDAGLGRPTGIDLPGEAAGSLAGAAAAPDGVEVAVGAGVTATPLQIAALFGAVAADGVVRRPFRAPRPMGGGEAIATLPGRDLLPRVRRALRAAVEHGTAHDAGLRGVAVAGKTGTARWEHGYHAHGWFAGWAPTDAPAVVIVVLLRRGLGRDAAARARPLFEAYFR